MTGRRVGQGAYATGPAKRHVLRKASLIKCLRQTAHCLYLDSHHNHTGAQGKIDRAWAPPAHPDPHPGPRSPAPSVGPSDRAPCIHRRAVLMERGHWNVVELGYEPPLSLGPTSWTGRAAMLLGLVATALIGVAAGPLLGGALSTAPKGSPPAVAPAVVVPVPAQTVAEDGCGDPVVHRGREGGPGGAAVRIEQLGDTGSLRPYTRISALLAKIDPDATSDEPRASALAQAHVPRPQLPPIILYGSAHPTPFPEVSAYAEPSPSLTTRTPGVSAYAGPGPSPASRPPVVDPIDVEPIDTTTVPRALAAPEVERRFLVARPGDTLAALLAALGTTGGDAQAILAALAERDGFGRSPLAGGEALTVLQEAAQSGAPRGPLLKISVERSASGPLVIARTDDGAYRWVVARQAVKASQPFAPDRHAGFWMTLRASLHALARAHGVKEAVVAELLQLSSRDFDLDRPLDAADEAELIYAPNKLDPPELVYAALTAQGRSRRYYRFTPPDDGGADFYDGDGRSATKLLLRKPVFAGRLGDRFGWRIHPILHDLRFHEGVDYVAPFGSPIAAAGEGVVEKIAEQWGYGEYIRIRHDPGYETTYAHVAGFPHGLKVGDRVRQGEPIAFVGSTGLSTGPHLYYEVRINGHNVDPLRVHLPAGRILQGHLLARFQRDVRAFEDLAHAPAEAEGERVR